MIEAAQAKGRPLPQWYLDEPEADPTDTFYLEAFWNLSSTRRYELGPIPWDIILLYGQHLGLDDGIINRFSTIIMAMDIAYIRWSRDEIEKRREQSRPASSSKGGKMGRYSR